MNCNVFTVPKTVKYAVPTSLIYCNYCKQWKIFCKLLYIEFFMHIPTQIYLSPIDVTAMQAITFFCFLFEINFSVDSVKVKNVQNSSIFSKKNVINCI